MGISRRFLLAVALLIAALVAGAAAEEQAAVDPAVPGEIAVGVKEAAEAAALRAELAQLREKISALESGIAERSQDLKTKDDGIAKLEKDIEEKSQKITTLQGEITSLQKKGSVAAEEQAGKAVAQAVELEKQIDILNKEIEAQSSQRTTLEARATKAEKKVQDLNLKLESLQKASGEQKRTIRKTERALKVAEEELMRLQNEATTKAKQLTEVHGAWLPPWLVTYSARYVEVVSGHWNEHGKPALDSFLQKASEKSAHAMKWAEPHIETAKMVLSLDPCILGYLALIILILCLKKLVPVKEKLDVLKKKTKPYLEKVSTKSVEIYEASRDAVTPHIVKLKAVSDPYFQEAKKLSKPYIDQVAELTKPHVEKIRTTLKPYTKRAVHAYGTFLESATTYHRQAQASISDYLHRHEITKSLVTKELVWFLASALLALPVFVIYRLLIDTFW